MRIAMKYFSSYLTVLVVLLPSALATDSAIQVVLKHCANSFNTKYIDKLLTPRKPINRTTSLTSMDVYIKSGVVLDKPIYIHFETFKKFTTQYRSIMINYKVELCEGLKLKNHPLYKFLFHKSNESSESNLLDSCPFQGHRFVKPYYTSYEILPPILPTGMWRTNTILTKGLNEQIFTLLSYYEITSTGLEEF